MKKRELTCVTLAVEDRGTEGYGVQKQAKDTALARKRIKTQVEPERALSRKQKETPLERRRRNLTRFDQIGAVKIPSSFGLLKLTSE